MTQEAEWPPILSKTAAALSIKHGGGNLAYLKGVKWLVAGVLCQTQQVYIGLRKRQQA
jgi:hypothetical protein